MHDGDHILGRDEGQDHVPEIDGGPGHVPGTDGGQDHVIGRGHGRGGGLALETGIVEVVGHTPGRGGPGQGDEGGRLLPEIDEEGVVIRVGGVGLGRGDEKILYSRHYTSEP